MQKRYQVFVSSTFKDLQVERQRVLDTLLRINCIPSGMELFSATDEEQFAYIKKVIDLCDFYVLITGARYGSIHPSGVSYTEKEYDYAVEKGIDVLAFIHKSPETISTANSDLKPAFIKKLKAFREKAMTGRMVQMWDNAYELAAEVLISINSAKEDSKASGWVRADSVPDLNAISELKALREENQILKDGLKKIQTQSASVIQNLAELDEVLQILGFIRVTLDVIRRQSKDFKWDAEASWREIFSSFCVKALTGTKESYIRGSIAESLYKKSSLFRENFHSGINHISDECWEKIKVQFLALGLVTTSLDTSQDVYWKLTKEGESLMFFTKATRSEK